MWLLNATGLWDYSQIKNTIIWCVTVATIMTYRSSTISNNKHFFKNAALDNLKAIIVLEFIINVHSFNIWIELILVPLSTFLAMLLAYSELDEKYNKLTTIINKTLMYLGTALIFHAAYKIYIDIPSFVTYSNFQGFMLPPILSITFLPFMYFIALFMCYETLFVRFGFYSKDPAILRHAKQITLQSFNINLYNLKQWSDFVTPLNFNKKENIKDAIQKFKSSTQKTV